MSSKMMEMEVNTLVNLSERGAPTKAGKERVAIVLKAGDIESGDGGLHPVHRQDLL